MNQPPPMYRDQRAIDADHLKLLSVFHFVGAGLALLGLLFLGAHFAVMRMFLTNPQWQHSAQSPPPAEFFAVFRWFYAVGALWLIASGILNLLSGLYLRTGRHRTFSLVVAGLNCLHMPLGTILGIFTIIVLMRDSVRERYALQA